jgi:uncharacterized membrane protein
MAWNTPFPPADFFKEFDSVAPQGSERLFNLFVDETLHRRVMDTREQTSRHSIRILGRLLAFLVVMAAFCLSAFSVAYDAESVAFIIGGGVLALIVTAFIRLGGNGRA